MVLGYESDTPVRCLSHSFTINTYYELAPPYPPFIPHVSMVCPGVVVFNTGDSLVALDIRVDTDQSRRCLFSVRFASDLCPMSPVSSDVGDDDIIDDNDDETLASSKQSAVLPAIPSSAASVPAVNISDEQVTANTPPADPRDFHRQNLSKLPVIVESPDIGDQRHLSGHSCEAVSQHDDEPHVDVDTSVPVCDAGANVCAHTPQRSHMKLSSSSSPNASDNNSDSVSISQHSDEKKEHSAALNFPITPPQLLDHGCGLNVMTCHSLSHVTSSGCSPVTDSPVVDSQCCTYSIRRYASAVTHAADVEGIQSRHKHTH